MKLLYIDLFCGAGGTSTGVENARHDGRQCAKVIGCVNHDANAIASHAANHPDALHFTEDIRTLELSPLTAHIAEMRRQYPDAFVVLWASLECTNFSKAKGGQPRDADSRTLAEHLFRYIEAINPDYIQIENVEEFMSWGDLDENGKPISKDAGLMYITDSGTFRCIKSAPCLHKAKYDTQADLLRRDMRDKFYYAMWNWIRRYWRNIGKAKDIAPQTAAAYERALDKQAEEMGDLKYRISSLTQWRDIQADPKWGFATDDAIDEIFRNLPRLVRDKRDGSIELIDYDNAAEWRGDLERKPSLYQWLPINGNTL